MTGDRVIRFTTAAVVCAVAAFAVVVSYSHIYGLGRDHGQDGTAARLLPLSVDGLILAASLVLLHEARNGRDAPGLARFMLWLGISATIGANIAYGAGYGLLGALISAWPAVAFIGTVEIATQQVRRARAPRAATIVPAVPEVPGDVEQAVRAAYAASVAAGAPLSQRARLGPHRLNRSGNSRPEAAPRQQNTGKPQKHAACSRTCSRRRCSPGVYPVGIPHTPVIRPQPADVTTRTLRVQPV